MHRWLAAMLPVLLLATTCTAQPVSLSRLQAGPGPRYVPVTDAFGIQRYAFLDTLLGIPPWIVTDSVIAGPTAGNPQLRRLGSAGYLEYSFVGDLNTGMRRPSSGVLALHAGNANPRITISNATKQITFDPDATGVADVTMDAGFLNIAGTLKIGTFITATPSTTLAGLSSGGVNSVVVGPGLTLANDTLSSGSANIVAGQNITINGDTINATAVYPRWDGGTTYAQAAIRLSLTTTNDTINFNNNIGNALSFGPHLTNAITFDTIPGSDYRGWLFDEQGHYEVSYQFVGSGTEPAANKYARFIWCINGSPADPFNAQTDRAHYIETTDKKMEAGSFHINVAAGQYLQLVARVNSGTSNYDMRVFRLQIKKIAD